MHSSVYLDSNATTSVLPIAAAAAMRVMTQQFGNPSSTHSEGQIAKALLEQARVHAHQALGVAQGTGKIVFTSGATEGIQTAILSALCALRPNRDKIVVYGATEHKAVPQSLAHWNTVLGLDLEIRALPVNRHGEHDLATLREWLPDVGLLCTMAANNETGVMTDLAGIKQCLIEQQ